VKIQSLLLRYTLVDRELEKKQVLAAVKNHPITNAQTVTALSKFHMKQASTEDDIREVQSVFCASPDVLAGDRLFPI
jgi:hypothetical protein